jgi:hypothetical protein
VPGGSPVINLHGAEDRLVNENADLLWTVDVCGENEDGIEIEQSEEEKDAATDEEEVGAWEP